MISQTVMSPTNVLDPCHMMFGSYDDKVVGFNLNEDNFQFTQTFFLLQQEKKID